jgi:hypothetical protein
MSTAASTEFPATVRFSARIVADEYAMGDSAIAVDYRRSLAIAPNVIR